MQDSPRSLEKRAPVFAEISALLGSPLDYERALPRIARLAVPALADLCAIDLLLEDGTLTCPACAHVDPTKEALAYETRSRHGFHPTSPRSVPAVIRSGQPVLVSEATESDLRAGAQHAEQLRIFQQLGPTSWMIVPLLGRERALGALTLAITESTQAYDRTDLRLAEMLATQIASAIQHARLYREAARARHAAEEANRAKDEFLSTLSHELRTPLNAVSGWATLLERGDLSEAQSRRALQIIRRNVDAQVRLVDDLLDMANVVKGRMRLAVQAVDLPDLIEGALEALAPAAEAKGIRVHSVLASPGAPVSGDPGRLQQVVWNLLSNAVKFTPRDGRIQIKLERVRSHIEITVSDTGQGIHADVLPHVFDRWRHGESSRIRDSGGLGIGLALVRHLVELHGGSVFAESAGEGQGATFVVKLPLMVAEVRAAPITQREPPLTAGPSIAGLRILLVDDDPTAIELIREVLLQAGCDVRESPTSDDEILRTLAEWRPDVLVSDIEMPGQDGYTLMRKVRALRPDAGGKTPAIALTAFSRAEDRIRSLGAGFNIHVSKPVDPAELQAIIASLAGRTA
jgi:signal transduction histidine kinase/ActR/RegA family two-component response regulator